MSGYGYSQDAGWINFNLNYGGASVDVNGEFSGWVFAEIGGWINTDGAKSLSNGELNTKIESTKTIINEYDNDSAASLSGLNVEVLLYNLCSQFFSESQCVTIKN